MGDLYIRSNRGYNTGPYNWVQISVIEARRRRAIAEDALRKHNGADIHGRFPQTFQNYGKMCKNLTGKFPSPTYFPGLCFVYTAFLCVSSFELTFSSPPIPESFAWKPFPKIVVL